MSSERRRAPRYQLIAEAEIIEPRSRHSYKARTSDVSLVGCFMNTANSLPAGTRVQVRVTHRETAFTADGQVTRSEPAMGIGIAFSTIKEDQQAILQQWLSDIARADRISAAEAKPN